MKRKILLVLYLVGIAGWLVIFQTNRPLVKRSDYIEALPVNAISTVNVETPAAFKKSIGEINWNEIDGKAVYAFNPVNEQVFFARNENTKLPIASITKLMTTLVALDYFSLTDSISITKPIVVMDKPLGLKVGDTIKMSEILKSALITSNNDSGNALAIFSPISKTTFIAKMNEKAQELGMTNTRFSNPTGFVDTDNYSTAKDLAILANAVIKNKVITDITAEKYATVHIDGLSPRNVVVYTTNNLLYSNKYVKGLKTGFTYKSGQCLILYFDISKTDKLITVVLNSSDRFVESNQLYQLIENGFR